MFRLPWLRAKCQLTKYGIKCAEWSDWPHFDVEYVELSRDVRVYTGRESLNVLPKRLQTEFPH